MGRSKWKGPYAFKNVKDIPRNLEITPKFLGSTFNVHNGKSYFELKVVTEMLGHKPGEFAFTRAKFAFKKKKVKKK